MTGLGRFAVGVAGGFAAAASKVMALDFDQLAKFLDQGNTAGLNELRVTIFIITPILMLLGGLLAWASSEQNRMKLLAIGCAAPAIIAPWTAHGPGGVAHALLEPGLLSTPAYAGDVGQVAPTSNFVTGFKALFGLTSPETQNYWVIVGSDKDLQRAKAFAGAVNAVAPDLQAFVGKRMPGNDYYPVIVGGAGGFLPLADAQALLERAKQVPIISGDPYLSNYPDRLPSPAG